MSDFMPSVDDVRHVYMFGALPEQADSRRVTAEMGREFDRWLAQVKADIVTEMAREFDPWLARVKADERAKVLAVVQMRHDELAQCHKQDDCHLLAKGIWLALDDVKEKIGGE